MITFNLLGRYGRFGNQMFQYAALYSIAKTRKYQFGIPYKVKSNNPYLNLCLDEAFENLSAEDSSDVIPIQSVQESSFTYNAGIFGVSDNTDIIGYFQSEKYFKNYRNDLLKEFTFKQHIAEKATTIRSITKEPIISVHLRLGDYKNLVGKHPIMQKRYYLQALDMLPKDLLIIGFSDEPEEASKIFDSLGKKYFVTQPEDKYTDMCTMTLCDYHVIANSSYSWWGAWLSESKKVIAPHNWFGNDKTMPQNWSDIYCKDWIII
jgi:hypothetical protein